jgi:hypothetical protein
MPMINCIGGRKSLDWVQRVLQRAIKLAQSDECKDITHSPASGQFMPSGGKGPADEGDQNDRNERSREQRKRDIEERRRNATEYRKAMGLKNPVVDQVEEPECDTVGKLRGVLKLLLAVKSSRVAKSLQVDAEQLYEGTVEEMEHTEDWKIAMKIALDHLNEDGEYYTKLRAAGLMGGKKE